MIMTSEQKAALWKYGRRVLFGIVVALVVIGFMLPLFPSRAKKGWITDDLNNALQVVKAMRSYADENGGKFPDSLEALVPKYCASPRVLTYTDGKTRIRWQYFSGHMDSEDPPAIVLSSLPDRFGNWVFGYSDGSAKMRLSNSQKLEAKDRQEFSVSTGLKFEGQPAR